MATVKTKQFLITDVNGEWYVGPVEAIDSIDAVASFEKSQGPNGQLNAELVGNDYDVYEVVGGPSKLTASVQITLR